MTHIPNELQKKDFRFVLLQPGSKKPFEKNWTTENNYEFNDKKLLSYLEKNFNYGVICGYGNLVVLDIDDISILKEVEKIIPSTFTVETGSGKRHYYFLREDTTKIIFTKDEKHFGELQGTGTQVVGPSSIHPDTKKEYKIVKNGPIAVLDDKVLKSLIVLYKDEEVEMKVAAPNWNLYSQVNLNNIMPITSLVNLKEMKKIRNEYHGSHPIHGSTTKMNFWINPEKNLWHCFRCNSGGDTLALASVLEGICDCKDFSINGQKLRGKNFIDTVKTSMEKYGLKLTTEEQEKLFNRKKPIEDTQITPEKLLGIKEEIEGILDSQLDSLNIQEPNWLIDKYMQENSFGYIGGKSNSFKSTYALWLAYSLANGLDFLGRKTKKCKVLYMNEENAWNTFAPLARMIRRGMDVKESENLLFTTFQSIRLDNVTGVRKIERMLENFKPEVIILDSFKRFVSFEENDANQVNNFFTNFILYLRKKYHVSFLAIHHTRKEVEGPNAAARLDSLRGSSEFVNLADFVHHIRRKPGKTWVEEETLKLRGSKDGEKRMAAIHFDTEKKELIIEDITRGQVKDGEIALNDCTNDIVKYLKEHKIERFSPSSLVEKLPLHGRKQIFDALKYLASDGALLKPARGQYAISKIHDLFEDMDLDEAATKNDKDIQEMLE